jgi:hypothetical protein
MLIQRTAVLATEAYWLLYAVTEGWRGFATWWERMQAMPSYQETELGWGFARRQSGPSASQEATRPPTEAKGTQSCDQSYGNCSIACHPVTKKAESIHRFYPTLLGALSPTGC